MFRTSWSPDARYALFLPVAFVCHLAEEWFGGFLGWVSETLSAGLDVQQFFLINGVGLIVVTTGSIVAVRNPRLGWLVASFAALFALNGVLHTLATLAFGRYAPGTITGLLVYLPAGSFVLRQAFESLPRSEFAGAVAIGFGLHAIVSIVALT